MDCDGVVDGGAADDGDDGGVQCDLLIGSVAIGFVTVGFVASDVAVDLVIQN